jgi:hypothetical protein
MVLLQTGLLAESGGVACVEEHAPEIWVLMKRGWRASYSLGCHHLLQTLVSLVWRKVPDSSLLLTGISSLAGTGGNLKGIVLSRVSSSVANVGLARAEESARQLIARW